MPSSKYAFLHHEEAVAADNVDGQPAVKEAGKQAGKEAGKEDGKRAGKEDGKRERAKRQEVTPGLDRETQKTPPPLLDTTVAIY